MKSYFKWFILTHILILIVVACSVFYFGISQVIVILLFIVLIEYLIYYLDSKYLPKRQARLNEKLVSTFNAERLSEGVVKFRLNAFDLFAKVEVDYKRGFQFANVETISFHIPAHQLERLTKKPASGFVEGKVGAVPTLLIYQTDGNGLEEARHELENML
jgi:uncharacterized membrane protein